MKSRTYWVDVFTGTTWQEFLNAGANVSGFSERRWATIQGMEKGDYLLCYVSGIMRWIGVLEVTGKAKRDSSKIWEDSVYPARIPVCPVFTLSPETGVPMMDLLTKEQLFNYAKKPNTWKAFVRSSPTRITNQKDGEAILKAIAEAQEKPVARPVDPMELARRPGRLFTAKKLGQVTVPDEELPLTTEEISIEAVVSHTEIQWKLLKFGSDLGFDVWVARNDRSRKFDGKAITDIPRLRGELPLQFDEATNTTIELIDVLWLRDNAIVAAFEIESTTSIYSGLLRMADLIAMQPNSNIPLYIVAPDDKRDRVLTQVNRPTFKKLDPPMPKRCKYISFTVLKRKISEVQQYLKYLKPEILDEIAESCEISD